MNETIERALYRGQDIKTGEWRFGDLSHIYNPVMGTYELVIQNGSKGYLQLNGISSYEVNPETVGQLTGLTMD